MMRDEKNQKELGPKFLFGTGFVSQLCVLWGLGSKVGLPAVLGVPFDPCHGFSVANRKRGVQHFPLGSPCSFQAIAV